MEVPRNHPRYESLMIRHKLVEGWEKGLVAPQGLIAHGRGEAFDYLIGERTTEEAERAVSAAAAVLILAERPVISVNGNVGALVPEGVCSLSEALQCRVEVNIFHRTDERVERLVAHLEAAGCRNVLGKAPDMKLSNLDHPRALCCSDGIFSADVVLVPLEDGDRCEALKAFGKKVITVDLNPLSRTARAADITIVDNIVRAFPNLYKKVLEMKDNIASGRLKRQDLSLIDSSYSNERNLRGSLSRMARTYP